MEKSYLLMIILNDVKRYRKVKSKLQELGCNRYTVIDTYGTTDILEGMEFSNMLRSTLSGQTSKSYNKTIFMVLPSEEEVMTTMDAVESVQHIDVNKPGKGIMFTIPIYTSKGVRFED